MASRDLVTFENGKYKRRVSSAETLDFLSVKIGSSGMELKETSGAFDFAAKKLSNIIDGTASTDAATKGQLDTAIGALAGAGLSIATGVLAVNVDGSTLEITTDTLNVKAAGITATELASNAVETAKIAADAVTGAKIRLANNEYLKARNAADTANVDIVKVDASGIIQLASLPRNASTPTNGSELVNKDYVDAVASGLDTKQAVRLATAAVLPAVTYDNGTSGVGATLTADAVGALSVDGIAVALNDRILVKNQAATLQNGIYEVTTLGTAGVAFVLTRTADYDGTPSGEVHDGTFTFVGEGSTNLHTGWLMNTAGVITIGTTGLLWTQFSAAGVMNAGAGMVQNGNDFDVVAADNSITVNADSVQVKLNAAGGVVVGTNGLAVNVDGVSVELSANALQLKDGGVHAAKFNADVVGNGVELNGSNAIAAKSDVTGGANLAKAINVSANGLAVKVDDTTIEGDATSGQLKVKAASISKAHIAADVAGLGLGQNVDGSLEVKVDGSTLEITTDTLNVKAAGITATQLASSVAGNGMTGGAGSALSVGAGEGIKVSSDAVAVDYAIAKTNDNAGTITARQVVYVKANGNIDLAIASLANLDQFAIGLVEDASIATATIGKIILRRGAIMGGFSGLTPGKLQYVGRGTAGSITDSLAGFVAGEFVYSIGRAISATELSFNPGETVLEY